MVKKNCLGKCAGAIIKKNGKILLLSRAFFPLGWAPPAGHVKTNESAAKACAREVKEEVGLTTTICRLVLRRKRTKSECIKGQKYHEWWVYKCEARGKIKMNKKEAKDIGWYAPQKISKLKLEPIWRNWFKILKLI